MRKTLIVLAVIFMICPGAFAETKTPDQLQKIIITPNRFSQKFKNSTAELSIITKEDIKNSGAEVLLDVFRTIKGVVVRDYYGNGARASVDLRGFGETSSSNALVLVDGRRANTPDLSGVDWMQIPLDRVERVEILHGGTGSVLYGDNAVGGVVNIITKSGHTKKPTFEVYSSAGSYNMNKESISCDGATDNTSYSFTLARFETNGYRKNSEYRSKDFGVKLKHDLNDAIALKLSGNIHDADLGLPGHLNDNEYSTLSHKDSTSSQSDDNVGEDDYYIKVGLEGLTFDIGILNLDLSFRRKTSDSFFPQRWIPTISKMKLDTVSFTPNFTCTLDLFGRPNKIITGIDIYQTNNEVNDYDSSDESQSSDNDIDKRSIGFYISDSFDITEFLSVDLGVRHEKIVHNLNYIDLTNTYPAVREKSKRKEEAYKGGLVYILNNETQAFFNVSKSFRSPLTDEFLYFFEVAPWNYERRMDKGLSTQTSLSYDCGVRHAFNEYLRSDITVFHMDLENEIYLEPSTYKNDNYEKTRRQGVNMQLDFKLTDRITAFANGMYTKARFKKGTYGGNTVPMVPIKKISIGLNLGLWKNLKVVPILNYVGKRYMINDQANQAGKLDAYFVADVRVAWEHKKYEFFFNVNNIFDRDYVEYAITNSGATAKNYYPSPRRNFTFGVKFTF
ncbi:TonB-dependent receptor family protein [Thermoproteota archaeon]